MKVRYIVLMMAMCSLLTGCFAIAAGGVGVTGVGIVQERSFGKGIDDKTILAQINSLYLQEDVGNLFNNVDVEVNEGRVMLTGNVATAESRIQAVKLAWQPKGVKEVINEIQITNKTGIRDIAKDTWITAQVKSKLLFNKDVASINYTVDTVNGVVYLMGIAQNQTELDTVTFVASTIKGVQKVISHVRLKDDVLRN